MGVGVVTNSSSKEIAANRKARSRSPAKDKRDIEIFKAWVAGETQESLAERYGLTQQAVSAVINRLRGRATQEQKAEFIAREIAKLLELSQMGMAVARSRAVPKTHSGEVVRDERGNVVRDHSGRLEGGRFAIEAGRELRKLLGLDAATKAQVETVVRYILEGVPEDEDV